MGHPRHPQRRHHSGERHPHRRPRAANRHPVEPEICGQPAPDGGIARRAAPAPRALPGRCHQPQRSPHSLHHHGAERAKSQPPQRADVRPARSQPGLARLGPPHQPLGLAGHLRQWPGAQHQVDGAHLATLPHLFLSRPARCSPDLNRFHAAVLKWPFSGPDGANRAGRRGVAGALAGAPGHRRPRRAAAWPAARTSQSPRPRPPEKPVAARLPHASPRLFRTARARSRPIRIERADGTAG